MSRAPSSCSEPVRAQIVAEGDGWSVFIPGFPISADGIAFDDVITEMIDALREYAIDWQERLRNASNHGRHRDLVRLIDMSSDDQLRDWLISSGT